MSLKKATSMQFAGERFVPTENGQIKYEHVHRYALSLDFVVGKSVLDIASGEGYGAALLVQVAQSVIGVDIDPESVKHSKHRYDLPNLSFLEGSCDSIPLPDASVDVVTSFETIEHHDKHESMMLEIKRVLKPNGYLIISSPNRLTYSDEPHYSNPFHVRELYYEEFNQLLKKHFKDVQVYGQRLATGSFVTSLQEPRAKGLKVYSGDAQRLNQQIEPLPSPIYFIAVCSDSPVGDQQTINSIYVDVHDDLFQGSETEKVNLIKELELVCHKHSQEIALAREYQNHLESEIEKHKEYQSTLEKAIARLEK